jgi:hypothetical protein
VDLVALSPGSDELDRLRADRDLPYIPVLLVSPQNLPDERDAGLRAGADDFVGIDLGEEDLLARVEALAAVARLAGPSRGELPGPAYLKERLAIEFLRAGRLGEPISLAIVDTGPEADPAELARQLAAEARRSDPMARCDPGLAIVLRNTHFAGAVVAARRIVQAFDGAGHIVVGVACHPSEEVRSAGELYAFACGALDRAREGGNERACVVHNDTLEV